jgi:4-diphosphocytidyl-2-C-methyl-D-erythritol kinase
MTLELSSPCKVNLVLNILGKRPDGFHELETLMQPVNLFDTLSFEAAGKGTTLTCSDAALPTDSKNLVVRAAHLFFSSVPGQAGARIHLEKRIPLAAGLGGGSGNAATTLAGLNQLFGNPLPPATLHQLAASLGSDIPFFLQQGPALATGRGEIIQPLEPFAAFKKTALVLIHPGFGISTPWAYQQLARFPKALNGRPGRAEDLAKTLRSGDLATAGAQLFNSLEAPALHKFPILALFQEFLREQGAIGALMSGSGSTTFALVESLPAAHHLAAAVRDKFGDTNWIKVVPL